MLPNVVRGRSFWRLLSVCWRGKANRYLSGGHICPLRRRGRRGSPGTRSRFVPVSGEAGSFDGSPSAQESFQGWLIADDAHPRASGVSHDTTGKQDDVCEEGPKVHTDILSAMVFLMHHQGKPRLDVPGQCGDDHACLPACALRAGKRATHRQVGPVADQVIQGHAQGIDAVLKLFDHVFLVASFVGSKDDLGGSQVVACGDVEEISDLPAQRAAPLQTGIVEEGLLAFGFTDLPVPTADRCFCGGPRRGRGVRTCQADSQTQPRLRS